MNAPRPRLDQRDLAEAERIVAAAASAFSAKVVGQNELRESLLLSLLAGGHLLIESVPGLAKTTAARHRRVHPGRLPAHSVHARPVAQRRVAPPPLPPPPEATASPPPPAQSCGTAADTDTLLRLEPGAGNTIGSAAADTPRRRGARRWLTPRHRSSSRLWTTADNRMPSVEPKSQRWVPDSALNTQTIGSSCGRLTRSHR
jgi:hypothetical protein